MATAILIGSMCIAGAINPEWLTSKDGDYTGLAYTLLLFIVYDLVSLHRPR